MKKDIEFCNYIPQHNIGSIRIQINEGHNLNVINVFFIGNFCIYLSIIAKFDIFTKSTQLVPI